MAFLGVSSSVCGTVCGKNCPELLTRDTRAPASRGQRDAGAVNPIRPGAVGQIGGSLRQGWSTWDRRSRPVGPSPETATTRASRDQSGDVEGCSAADRGRSEPLRDLRPCIEASPAFVPFSVTARSGEPLTPPPPEALPIVHGAVELSGGLVGIGDVGCPSRATTSEVNAGAAGEAGMQAAPWDWAWRATAGAEEVAGAGTVATAARTTGANGGTAASSWTGCCDRTPASCGVGADIGRDTVATTWVRGRGTATARTTGLRTSTGWTGSRGTERDSTLCRDDPTMDGRPGSGLESPSDDAAMSIGSPASRPMPVPGCPRFSVAWLTPAPSSHPAVTRPASTANRNSARTIPRGAYLAPPALGMVATGSPSTLPSNPAWPGQ